MNKILLIVVFAAAVIAGISIAYYLQLPLAVDLVDGAKAKFTEITGGGGIDAQTLLTGGSLASAGVGAVSAYNQFKGKVSAQTTAAKEAILKSDAVAQVGQLTETKDTLLSQVTEITAQKDDALKQVDLTKQELTSVKKQLETQVSQTQALSTMNTNTISNLWKNSGGNFWTDPSTGEKFKLLSLVTEKVI